MVFNKVNVPQETFALEVPVILKGMVDLLVEKNRMYGGASMDLGLTGVYVHIHDKDTRIKSLLEKLAVGAPTAFEGLEDTLKDIIGYATIGLVILKAQEVAKTPVTP